ncbi:hypothetical protein BHM03_00003337 [Ensete ventricosum]|nr:hypothetical protein BHM03_00003337 [Ensete ventricosum]
MRRRLKMLGLYHPVPMHFMDQVMLACSQAHCLCFVMINIGVMLPDDEEALLSGIMDDFDLNGLPGQVDELEDYDLFGSVGGMELDSDPTESIAIGVAKSSVSDGSLGNGFNQYSLPNGVGTISGEHPYGEHPSRTLFVRNINSNVEDSELRLLFEFIGITGACPLPIRLQGFNGKKWEKFNSEKVASLAYARIQGRAALVAHFQNSSLMNEDKRCRPILFDSEGAEAGDQVKVQNSLGNYME